MRGNMVSIESDGRWPCSDVLVRYLISNLDLVGCLRPRIGNVKSMKTSQMWAVYSAPCSSQKKT